MKTVLRHIIIDTICLYLVSMIASGLKFGNGFTTLLLAGLAISVVSIIAKPVINLLLLPINLITFGLFKWVASSFVLYITSLLVPSFKILYFNFPGLSSRWIDIPSLHFKGILAYICFSFLFSLVSSFIYWLIK